MGNTPAENCDAFLLQALEITRQMIILADDGEGAAQDDSCRVLYGVVRDAAYHIRQLAEKERERHIHRKLGEHGEEPGQMSG